VEGKLSGCPTRSEGRLELRVGVVHRRRLLGVERLAVGRAKSAPCLDGMGIAVHQRRVELQRLVDRLVPDPAPGVGEQLLVVPTSGGR
jgi:hypothetical protein